jgi:hypothetical protein
MKSVIMCILTSFPAGIAVAAEAGSREHATVERVK